MAVYNRAVHQFTMDLRRPSVKRLKLVNGDTANTFIIMLKDDGAAVELDASLHKIVAVFTRADGQVYTQDAETGVTFTSGGVVTIDVYSSSFRIGTNKITLQIYKRENSSATEYPLLLTTQEQTFNARSAAIEGESHSSASQLPMLERYVLAAKSYANGSTGTREGENTDNAMYYKDLAEQAVQGGIVDPTIDAWLDDHSTHIDGVITDEIDEWLNEHPEATTTVQDGSITIAKLNSEIVKASANLFNPNDPDFVANYKLNNDGSTTATSGKFVSGFIPLRAGQTVCVNYPTGTYGSSSSLVLYNSGKQRTGYVNPSRYTDSRGIGYLKYNVPANTSNAYFRATGNMSGTGTYMYVYASEMPTTYEPYADGVTLASSVKVPYANIKDVAVSKDETEFVKINPTNINDLSSMVVGVIKNSSSNGDLDSSVTNYRSTDYIPVEEGETYKLSIYGGVYYGSGFLGIAYYDSNKSYKGHIVPTGGISTTATVDTITIPTGASYIRVSYPATRVTNPKLWYTTQIFKGDNWTQMYLPHDGEYRLQGIGLMPDYSAAYNCLYGKKAMWNGDSICAADNDAQGGWAFRIGAANGMYAKNYAVAGGTIAENTGTNVHSVSATLDGMITDFPDADYIIIEGGTNDADLIGDSGIGTFDADDFTDAYIQALNKDTFSGALESIFYRLVTQMKGKHIGYIIPQKMGHTEVLVARRRTYFDRAISIAQKWGIPVLDLWNNLYFNWRLAAHWDQTMTTAENEAAGNLYLDGQHLTTTGYSVQSPIIADWMKGF